MADGGGFRWLKESITDAVSFCEEISDWNCLVGRGLCLNTHFMEKHGQFDLLLGGDCPTIMARVFILRMMKLPYEKQGRLCYLLVSTSPTQISFLPQSLSSSWKDRIILLLTDRLSYLSDLSLTVQGQVGHFPFFSSTCHHSCLLCIQGLPAAFLPSSWLILQWLPSYWKLHHPSSICNPSNPSSIIHLHLVNLILTLSALTFLKSPLIPSDVSPLLLSPSHIPLVYWLWTWKLIYLSDDRNITAINVAGRRKIL